MLSWSEKAMFIGSTTPVLAPPDIGSAPNTITCLSVSLTIVCRPTVGDKFAPDSEVIFTALVEVPLDSSQ